MDDTTRLPQHHVELTKDGTTVAIDLCDSNGIFDPKAIQKEQQPRLSIKMAQGGTKHSDFEPPYASLEQRDFSGGRGLNDLDLDETRFMDSYRVNTWKEGRAILAPMATFGTGYRDAHSNIWDTRTGDEKKSIIFRDLYGSTSYMSMKFTTGAAGYDADTVGCVIREYGSGGSPTLLASIWSDDGGDPDSSLAEVELGMTEISEITVSTLEGAYTLAATTSYHFVVRSASGDSDHHYKIGCKTEEGGAGRTSSDGSTWAAASYEPYYRVTDANTPFTSNFFEYRGALYCWMTFNDGSDPKLYINGIIGQVSSSTSTVVTDSTKSMTANEYQYGTLMLFGGHGSETGDRYRKIASHTDTAFTVSPAWASVPDASTYYAVIGQEQWTEITGHGLTGPWVTDVLSINNLVYTAQGDERDIWRAYLPGMTGATWTREQGNRGHFIEAAPDSYGRNKIWLGRKSWKTYVEKADPVWGSGSESNLDFGFSDLVTNGDMELDANWSDVGTVATNERSGTQEHDGTYSRHVSVAGDDAGIGQTLTPTSGDFYRVSAQIWVVSGTVTMEMGAEEMGSVSNTGAWIHVWGNRKAASGSEDIEFLSDGGAAEFYVDGVSVIEHPTYIDNVGFERITNMLAYGEPDRLWVMTTGGAYMEDNGDMMSIPLHEFKSARDERNGWAAIVHDMYLYLSFLDTGVERYYKGNLDDIGPNRDEGLPRLRRGYVYSFAGYPGRIYAAIHAGRVYGYSSILLYNGVGWHEVYRHPTVGEPITGLHIQPIPGPNAGSTGPAIDRLWFSVGSDLMWLDIDHSPTFNTFYRYHYEGWIETSWMYYGKKDIEKYWKQLKIYLERQDDDTADSTNVFAQYKKDSDTSWTDIGTFDTEPSETISIGVTAKRIKFRLLLRTENMKYTPIIRSVIVDFIEQVPTKDVYTLTFLAQDNQITLQGSPNFDRVETNMTTLEGWLDDPDPASIASQISLIDGKSVKLLSIGYRPLNVSSKSQKERLYCTMKLIEV